ncbi:protein TIC 100 [Impatiens glandulifera]|uniref:protein TIC 100 n=1 Tax=Impatiens glandulifera TaxID=253017 RepID=UPI001FB06821|nr:protein TIC 100 [Impatiens glandulifera]
MPEGDDVNPKSSEKQQKQEEEEEDEDSEDELESDDEIPEIEEEPEEEESESSDSDSDEDDEPEVESAGGPIAEYVDDNAEIPDEDESPDANVKRFMRVLNSKSMRREQEEEEKDNVYHEDLFDFPKDPENWREQDLKELWGDAPPAMTKPGWDPNWIDEDELEIIREEIEDGNDPPIAPFYVPYRKPYPVIPDNHFDISNPKSVIEELDRIEEFMIWVSYIFEDGSSYEGTVWDDLAHGKGVYIAEEGLVRYEGEWLQNNMEGHGVVEVDIPDIEPVPGSKLEAKMRAEGRMIYRDSLSPEDRRWLEMDIEDTMLMHDGNWEVPFYENEEWVNSFGSKPEKGRYRYAGEWKHGRMHGCGVYDFNEQPTFGRFYFGEFLEDPDGCDENISAMHAGIAEVAAAKARMFVNKPDGMVREERGPYTDPQHPYFYEEDDVWQAPGFINQFYEVPDYWKMYIHEVDEERQMWLNSFYKAPLRLPMPAELEHWWSNEEKPEFILINKEPEPDPEDPTKLVYTEDPLILHTPTGRIIDYVEDEEHGVRLFWQPPLKEDGSLEDPDDNGLVLPLGFDEFYGRVKVVKEKNMLGRILTGLENTLKPTLEKIDKWVEEKKKETEEDMELIEKELECAEAEMDLEEEIEDMDEELKLIQEEEERKVEDNKEGDVNNGGVTSQDDARTQARAGLVEEADAEEEEDDENEEEEDDTQPSSFGSIADDKTEDAVQKGNKRPKSPFSSSSLSFASSSLASPFSLVSAVPSQVQRTFLAWKNRRVIGTATSEGGDMSTPPSYSCASFPNKGKQNWSLKARKQTEVRVMHMSKKQSHLPWLSACSSSSTKPGSILEKESWPYAYHPATSLQNILSLHYSLDVGIQ